MHNAASDAGLWINAKVNKNLFSMGKKKKSHRNARPFFRVWKICLMMLHRPFGPTRSFPPPKKKKYDEMTLEKCSFFFNPTYGLWIQLTVEKVTATAIGQHLIVCPNGLCDTHRTMCRLSFHFDSYELSIQILWNKGHRRFMNNFSCEFEMRMKFQKFINRHKCSILCWG